MGPVLTSRADRERHVAQMFASSHLEDCEPDEAHQQLLNEYIEGTASLDDLLNHARAYAATYRSRLADDGGTYYMLPRDQHLFPDNLPTGGKINLPHEAEQDTELKKEEPADPEVTALVDTFFRQYRP